MERKQKSSQIWEKKKRARWRGREEEKRVERKQKSTQTWNKREGDYWFDELGFPQTCDIKTKVWFVACFQDFRRLNEEEILQQFM